jgi:hypothetical protein
MQAEYRTHATLGGWRGFLESAGMLERA